MSKANREIGDLAAADSGAGGLLGPELVQFFDAARREVDAALRTLLTPHGRAIANLDDAALYAAGLDPEGMPAGKRLRSALCLLAARDLGGSLEPAVPFAAAIELMHNFCLVHDDIEDGDDTRRGHPAVWRKYGLAHGINIGDYLLTRQLAALLMDAPGMSAEVRLSLIALMEETLYHTHRGQALDMNARGQRLTLDEYFEIVETKTGHYLAAPLVAGALVAGADEEVIARLRGLGPRLGRLFQVRDDVIDLSAGKGRGSIGSDLYEGKGSFPVAWAFEHGSAAQASRLQAILDLPRAETTEAHVEEALAIFRGVGAMEAAGALVDRLEKEILAETALLPEPLASNLMEVIRYLATRGT